MSRLASSSSTSASTSTSPLPSRSGTPSSSRPGASSSSSSSSSWSSSSWEAQRRATRSLESQLDARLTRYATLASKIASGEAGGEGAGRDSFVLDMDGSGAGASEGEEEHVVLQREIEGLLAKLQTATSHLSSLLDSPSLPSPPTAVQRHALQRHREVLIDFERDFRRSRDNVRHAIDRRDLVGRVRGDISAYKAAHASDQDEALLAERGRLDHSHRMIDGTLEQAYATLTDFRSQRQVLTNVANRMSTTAAQVPALNGIMTMIARRRRRDSVIIGCVVGGGTVLLLMYMTRGA